MAIVPAVFFAPDRPELEKDERHVLMYRVYDLLQKGGGEVDVARKFGQLGPEGILSEGTTHRQPHRRYARAHRSICQGRLCFRPPAKQ